MVNKMGRQKQLFITEAYLLVRAVDEVHCLYQCSHQKSGECRTGYAAMKRKDKSKR